MPIPVQLHDGTQIHFPDGTPDEHIDAAVMRHLGLPAQGAQQPAEMPPEPAPVSGGSPELMLALMQAIGGHATDLQSQQQQQREADAQQRQRQDENMAQHTAVKVDAINQASAGVQQGLAGLIEGLNPLQELAANSAHIPELVLAINNLSATVLEIGKAIIATMHLPSEVTHGADGLPKTIGRKSAKKGQV